MNDRAVEDFKPDVIAAARVLVGFWLAGWFWKWEFFEKYFFSTLIQYPVLVDFFPPFLRSPLTVQFFYVLPLLIIPVLVRPKRFYFYWAALVMVLSSAVLLLHQDTHNDATFITSLWTGLWLLWFVSQMHRRDEVFFFHARSLALCVIALMFWGGFIGKLSPEYWSGKALADIFMQQNYNVVGDWVRANFAERDIRSYFLFLGKLLIIGEGVMAFVPLLPYRFACWLGIPLMLGISLFTTWLIFSVLFCLMGLLIAGSCLKK